MAYTRKFLHKFLNWVNGLGFEKTFLGKAFKKLEELFRLRQVLLCFLFSLFIAFIILYEVDFLPSIQIGDVSKSEIKSKYSFEFLDDVSTELKKLEAESNTPLVFDYDPEAYEKNYESIYKAFSLFRKKVSEINWKVSSRRRDEKIKSFLQERESFNKILSRNIPVRLFEWLTLNKFSVSLENAIISQLEGWSDLKIQDKALLLDNSLSDTVILRNIVSLKERSVPRSELLDLKTDVDQLKFVKNRRTNFFSKRAQNNILTIARLLVIPNVTFNKNETVVRKKQARQAVPDVKISIKKNQTIVTEGAVIQPSHLAIFNEIKKIKAKRNFGVLCIMVSLLMTAFLLGFFSFVKRFTQISYTRKDIALMTTLVVLAVVFMKVFWLLAAEVFLQQREFLTLEFFFYLAPLTFVSLILGVLILSGELIWIFTLFMSFLYAMFFNFQMYFFFYAFLGGLVASRYVYFSKKRSDIYLTGLRVGLVNVFMVFVILSWNSWGQDMFWTHFFWQALAAFIGGVSASFLAMMFIPLFENLFNYTTDIKLLELSNLSHPLLQNLFVKAPGTYHHSIVVGSMVEVAAERIGCNPLLAKVMAYYHDIGKAHHPEYFIENQRPNSNPHDELSPHMSRTILVAHVKDGAEMALEYDLGKPIIDGILQHHGTTLISFFYNKALSEEDDKSEIFEEDFRYPGPKPQFREAALVMLGDSIEAAARSLNEPTTVRLQNIVHDVIREKFLDNQLDQCDLTLKDLSIIEESFEQVILSIHHQRIEYPESS